MRKTKEEKKKQTSLKVDRIVGRKDRVIIR